MSAFGRTPTPRPRGKGKLVWEENWMEIHGAGGDARWDGTLAGEGVGRRPWGPPGRTRASLPAPSPYALIRRCKGRFFGTC
jgi:hypothetical protein